MIFRLNPRKRGSNYGSHPFYNTPSCTDLCGRKFLRRGLVRRPIDLGSGRVGGGGYRWGGLGGDGGGGGGCALVSVLVESELLHLHRHLAEVVVSLSPA